MGDIELIDELITEHGQIGQNMKKLLNTYGLKLDIIYDDPQFNYAEKYSKIYLWNSTIS